jgi:photosystem II stability/assembly factor-like uncharacterized protein
MSNLAMRLAAASITFALGIIIATLWVLPQFRRSTQVASSPKSSGPQAGIRCPVLKGHQPRHSENSVIDGRTAPWKATDLEVSGREDLGVLQFLNASEGWVGGSKGGLYKTVDAGKSWQKVKLDVPPDAIVNSIFFINPSVGWIIVSQEGEVFDNINTLTGRILRTTDGGNSWEVQYSGKAVSVDKIQFVNEQEGWAVGARLPEQVQYVGLILRTTDGGKHWADVSPKVDKDELGNSSYVTNISAVEPLKAIILKFDGIFYSTEDGGRSWKEVAALPEEPPQAFLNEFKATGYNRMWAVGGADSIEGMWGTLARMDGNCFWTSYSVGGVRFSDAAVLSEQELIVSGAIPSRGQDKTFESPSRDGLILYSSDGGRHWAIAYRDKRTQIFNALAATDSNNVWAVGRNGHIIHLARAAAK